MAEDNWQLARIIPTSGINEPAVPWRVAFPPEPGDEDWGLEAGAEDG